MSNLQSLIKIPENIKESDVFLYCFPFAGGGASAFQNWQSSLFPLKVCPIQLPGREERITQTPYTDMDKLVTDICEIISQHSNNFFLFGHSMGSKIAYLVEEKLEQKGIVSGLLIVSGGRIPSVPELNPISKLPDKEFVDGLLRFNGMPSEIIKNKQLFEFFLPIIRADFILDESYYPQKVNKLQCPILAFGGKNDMEANLEEIKKWAECTFSHFAYKIFEGEHFFVKEQETLVLEEIRKNVL